MLILFIFERYKHSISRYAFCVSPQQNAAKTPQNSPFAINHRQKIPSIPHHSTLSRHTAV